MATSEDFLLRVVAICTLLLVSIFVVAVLADVFETGYEIAGGFYVVMASIGGGLSAVLVARFRSNGGVG